MDPGSTLTYGASVASLIRPRKDTTESSSIAAAATDALAQLRFETDVRSIFEDTRGHYWFGSAMKGVARFDGEDYTYFNVEDGLSHKTTPYRAPSASFRTPARDTAVTRRSCDGGAIGVRSSLPGQVSRVTIMRHRPAIHWILLGALLGACTSERRPDSGSAVPAVDEGQALLRFEYREGPHGMHNAGVRAIHEDGRGNVWFGTHLDGLARFDGRDYAYFDVQGGHRDLNRVWRIREDRGGTLWFRTGRGVARFDGERIVHHGLSDAPQADDWTLEAGDLWFAGSDPSGNDEREGEIGIFRHDGETFTFLPIPVPEHLRTSEDFAVVAMWRGNGARMWLATWDAVIGYDGETLTIIDDERLGHTDATGFLHVKCMYEDSRGRVWIGNNGIGVILVEGDTITNFTQAHGVGRRDHRSGGTLTHPQPGDAPEGAPSLHRVFSIGEDSDGNIWFGTTGQGAWRYDGESLRQFTAKDGLGLEHVATFHTDRRGDLWVGGKGVYRFDGASFERVH